MEITSMLQMGLPVHVTGNTLMVKLKENMEHPLWMTITLGDQPRNYNWLPINGNVPSTIVMVSVNDKEYPVSVNHIEFINK